MKRRLFGESLICSTVTTSDSFSVHTSTNGDNGGSGHTTMCSSLGGNMECSIISHDKKAFEEAYKFCLASRNIEVSAVITALSNS